MALVEINWHPSARDLRIFAVLQAIFFSIVAAWIYHRSGAALISGGMVAASLTAALIGLVAPHALRPMYVTWTAVALPVGWTVSHLLMAALFYLVIAPIGLMMRALGRDPLQRKFDRSASTYWRCREVRRDSSRYFRQF
jgi:hypothetical protein